MLHTALKVPGLIHCTLVIKRKMDQTNFAEFSFFSHFWQIHQKKHTHSLRENYPTKMNFCLYMLIFYALDSVKKSCFQHLTFTILMTFCARLFYQLFPSSIINSCCKIKYVFIPCCIILRDLIEYLNFIWRLRQNLFVSILLFLALFSKL